MSGAPGARASGPQTIGAGETPAVPSRRGIVAGGNWIVDHVKLIERWPAVETITSICSQMSSNGGAPYNVLKDLARLGAAFPLEAIGLVGDDAAGAFIREDCMRHGIDPTQLRTTTKAPTSYTDVMTERGSGRRTFFHCRGANAELGPEHFDFVRTRAKIFHFGYFLLLDRLDELVDDGAPRPAVVEVFRAARDAGLRISADLVSASGDLFSRVVRPALPQVDWLFLNEFEIAQLTGVPTTREGTIDRAAIERAAEQVLAWGVREWAVVHFPAAVLAANASGEKLWQPSVRMPAAEIKGTAGAGDALAGGVLYGLHEGWPMRESLRLGVCTAAASLLHPTCSEGVGPRAEVVARASRFGFHDAPP